ERAPTSALMTRSSPGLALVNFAHMRLYKFLETKYAISNLLKNRIKISEYRDMNDPFELDGVILYCDELPHLVDEYRRSMMEVVRTGGAICFAGTYSEPLLWSHYADKHRGCCIGSDIAESESLRETIPCREKPRIRVDISGFSEAARRLRGQIPPENVDREFDKLVSEHVKITDAVMLSKFAGWNYERERRLLIHLKEDQRDGDLYFAEFD